LNISALSQNHALSLQAFAPAAMTSRLRKSASKAEK